LNVKGEKYVLQTPETNRKTSFQKGYNKFQIFKEMSQNITFNDFIRKSKYRK